MKRWLYRSALTVLPKKTMSRLFGKMARHPASKKLIPAYIRMFDVDTAPIKKPMHQFEHLLDFFIREYHEEARPIDSRKDVIVSPVDGVVAESGDIQEGTLLQAKGVSYTLKDLLGDQKEYAEDFHHGTFITIYLSPRDYHRIHMPIEGNVHALTHIAGQLFPVNRLGVTLFPGLFTKNERVISYIHSPLGKVAVVKVGATNVGSIRVAFDEKTEKLGEVYHRVYDPPIYLHKGAELGRFELGSTVILLFDSKVEWMIPPIPGTSLVMGQALAHRLTNK